MASWPGQLDARAARLADLRRQVRRLLADLDGSQLPEPGQFLAALELTVPVVDAGTYFTREQRQSLVGHAAGLGDGAVDDLRAEWLGLVRQLRDLLRHGVPPSDRRVRPLAVRWYEIAAALRPAGSDLDAAVSRVWTQQGATIDGGLANRVSWLDAGDLNAVVHFVRLSNEELSGAG